MKTYTFAMSMFLALLQNIALAASSRLQRYSDDEDYISSSGDGIGFLFLIGLSITAFLLFIAIERFFPSYQHPKVTAFLISVMPVFVLPENYGFKVIAIIGTISILLLITTLFPALTKIWLMGFSVFSSLFFLGELFSDQRIEYLLGFAVLPTIAFIYFKFFKAK